MDAAHLDFIVFMHRTILQSIGYIEHNFLGIEWVDLISCEQFIHPRFLTVTRDTHLTSDI